MRTSTSWTRAGSSGVLRRAKDSKRASASHGSSAPSPGRSTITSPNALGVRGFTGSRPEPRFGRSPGNSRSNCISWRRPFRKNQILYKAMDSVTKGGSGRQGPCARICTRGPMPVEGRSLLFDMEAAMTAKEWTMRLFGHGRLPAAAPGSVRKYTMRMHLVAVRDDVAITDEEGEPAFSVDGRALQNRDTLIIRDRYDIVLYRIPQHELHQKDAMVIEADGGTAATDQTRENPRGPRPLDRDHPRQREPAAPRRCRRSRVPDRGRGAAGGRGLEAVVPAEEHLRRGGSPGRERGAPAHDHGRGRPDDEVRAPAERSRQ